MNINEIWQRFVYGNFVQGFFDIKVHAQNWWNMISFSDNSEGMSDWSFRFFNDMVTSIQRYSDYPDYYTYDQSDRAGYI